MAIRLYFDIETIPDQSEGALERHLDRVTPPANYKKQESIDKWMAENAEAVALESYKKTALGGLYGEICSMSWAIDDGKILHMTRQDETEAKMLEAFWDDLYYVIRLNQAGDDTRATWAKLEWVGHNILEFDLRLLKQRCMVNRVKPSFNIPADARHGNGAVFDTMKEWAGFRGYVKQDELIDAFGIELPDWAADVADIEGSQVYDLWQARAYDTISIYNQLDVWKVRELHKRMTSY